MTKHTRKNIILTLETAAVFVGIGFLSVFVNKQDFPAIFKYPVQTLILIFQGFWFYRLYIFGHEASHWKLFDNKIINDIIGSIFLFPILTPINIFRKIHNYHHGFNRKNYKTSCLDTFTTKKLNGLKKIYFYSIWYLAIFAGGMFLHSLVSVVLFLFIPPFVSRKISPAFNNWTMKNQITAILLFLSAIGFHSVIYLIFGIEIYLYVLAFPLLSFAWILSMFVYIFHYRTTVGDATKYNARSLNRVSFLSWILMNFNQHATHHQKPDISWYDLPGKRIELPEEFRKLNQNTKNMFTAVFQQFKGPVIIDESLNKEVVTD